MQPGINIQIFRVFVSKHVFVEEEKLAGIKHRNTLTRTERLIVSNPTVVGGIVK